MSFNPTNPLIVQSDRTLLLETANPRFEEARDQLSLFAELLKSPEHVHTYRVTPLSLWNAAALGHTPGEVKSWLEDLTKYPLPSNVLVDIDDFMARYGRVRLIREGERLFLESDDHTLLHEISHQKLVIPHLLSDPYNGRIEANPQERGLLKHAMIRVGFPVEGLAG